MRPFLERAEKVDRVDRVDFEATAKITHDLRRAMVESGIADRIQRRADAELSEKEGGEAE